MREAARYYAKLGKLGHELGYLDVGGGLGVDYDGSRSVNGVERKSIFREYADGVAEGFAEYYRNQRGP